MAPTFLLNTTFVAIVDYALYVFFLSVSMTLLGLAVWPAVKGWQGEASLTKAIGMPRASPHQKPNIPEIIPVRSHRSSLHRHPPS